MAHRYSQCDQTAPTDFLEGFAEALGQLPHRELQDFIPFHAFAVSGEFRHLKGRSDHLLVSLSPQRAFRSRHVKFSAPRALPPSPNECQCASRAKPFGERGRDPLCSCLEVRGRRNPDHRLRQLPPAAEPVHRRSCPHPEGGRHLYDDKHNAKQNQDSSR